MSKIDSLKQLLDNLTNYHTDTDVWIEKGSSINSDFIEANNFAINYRIIADVNDRDVSWIYLLAEVLDWHVKNCGYQESKQIDDAFEFDVVPFNEIDSYIQFRLNIRERIQVERDDDGKITDARPC